MSDMITAILNAPTQSGIVSKEKCVCWILPHWERCYRVKTIIIYIIHINDTNPIDDINIIESKRNIKKSDVKIISNGQNGAPDSIPVGRSCYPVNRYLATDLRMALTLLNASVILKNIITRYVQGFIILLPDNIIKKRKRIVGRGDPGDPGHGNKEPKSIAVRYPCYPESGHFVILSHDGIIESRTKSIPLMLHSLLSSVLSTSGINLKTMIGGS